MPSPSGETELRRLRMLVSTGKHYRDAYNASLLRLIPADYPSAMFALHHVATNGYRIEGVQVDTGHATSRAPAYDPWAMEYLKREQKYITERGLHVLMRLNTHLHGEEAKHDIA